MITVIEPTIEHIVNLASDRTGAISADELAQMLYSGNASLLSIDDKTFMAVFIKNKELWVVAVYGGNEGWIDQANTWLDETASLNDCNSIRFMGRKGWVKALGSVGYNQTGVVMKKEIGGAK